MQILEKIFPPETVQHILLPRKKLFTMLMCILVFECLIVFLWQDLFVIVSVFLMFPFVYIVFQSAQIWKRYYSLIWYISILFIGTGMNCAVRYLFMEYLV